MKKLISLFLIVLLSSSCLTIRKIEKNCDKFAKICIVETVKETVYRDTTIYRTDTIEIPLPVHDTLEIIDTVIVDSDGFVFLPTIHEEFGIIGVDAGVHYSILKVSAYLTDSTILVPIRDTITLEKVIKEQSSVSTIEVKYIPSFYKFTFYMFFIVSIILIGMFIYFIKKRRL